MILLASVTVAFAFAVAADPIVQLSHGGQLQGKHILYNDVEVAVFLGIPYAKPPVDELRFKKPVAYPAWTGVRDAKTQSPNCPQKDVMQTGPTYGSEDCLHLDITVPGEVNSKRQESCDDLDTWWSLHYRV
ncbi:hypothetical protein EB796_003804 [Bugula neritina]|uniref:Carboxylesterase type B domain-containing protein n=1 Tax=Bugula neritina TaxID=10212 RepID=A0A7J7KI31_BUGNE|nr:hypothetical protein EB796_003804 [Bugula neritina]